MHSWPLRVVVVLAVLGLVLSIVLGSALPIVLAICLCGVLAAAEIHTR
jgi:hypothetical protein